MSARSFRGLLAVVVLMAMVSCSSKTATPAMPSTPTLSAVPALMVPASLKATPEILSRYDAAWRRMQAGDTARATSEFNDVLRRMPGFYPASTALGYIAALDRKYDEAVRRFDAAIALDRDLRVLPAAGRQRGRRAETADLDVHRQPEADRRILAELHRHARVTSQVTVGSQITVEADVPRRIRDRFLRREIA